MYDVYRGTALIISTGTSQKHRTSPCVGGANVEFGPIFNLQKSDLDAVDNTWPWLMDLCDISLHTQKPRLDHNQHPSMFRIKIPGKVISSIRAK